MIVGERRPNFSRKPGREFAFIPRIINPVKMANALVLSAGEEVRQAGRVLQERMPWVKTQVLSSPTSVSDYRSDQASVFIFDDTALTIIDADKIREKNRDAVLVLLTSNPFIYCSPPQVAREKFPYTSKSDLVFAMNNKDFPPQQVITSVVRAAEDLLNIEKYSRAKRFIFLIVDDEPRWFSQFLPVLYGIIGQRADVMITRTYEETLRFLFGVEKESEIDKEGYRFLGYGDDVVCLITDIFFPKGNDLSCDAGIDLLRLAREYYPRYPIIIASKARVADELKDVGFVLPKGDPGSLEKLRDYLQNFTGMGDFVVCDKTGEELRRAKNIHEVYELILEAEKETDEARKLRELIQVYADNDHFSTWLYMHSFRELGDLLRPQQSKGRALFSTLKRHLRREILRMDYTPLNIEGNKIFELDDLLRLLRTVNADKLQPFSDNDAFSSWLDRKGYPELAEEFRPIHMSGEKLRETLVHLVEKWVGIYRGNNGENGCG
ncbi:MAG: hypothetical protein NTX17_05500 [Candidatus Eisenbacteria bacterium]|nr:hypothetical protein [Candidatus Eisenbacteria bacterium]